jgi:hypothetical protein
MTVFWAIWVGVVVVGLIVLVKPVKSARDMVEEDYPEFKYIPWI